MKLPVFALVVIMSSAVQLSAQIPRSTLGAYPARVDWSRGNCSLMDFDSDPEAIHNTANTFAAMVGDLLKREYPIRIVDVSVQITYRENAIGRKGFEISWDCRWEKTTADKAQYYFDRRGTLLTNENQASVETAKKIGDARVKFQRQYGNAEIYPTQISTFTSDGQGRTWYLVERFITAHR